MLLHRTENFGQPTLGVVKRSGDSYRRERTLDTLDYDSLSLDYSEDKHLAVFLTHFWDVIANMHSLSNPHYTYQ